MHLLLYYHVNTIIMFVSIIISTIAIINIAAIIITNPQTSALGAAQAGALGGIVLCFIISLSLSLSLYIYIYMFIYIELYRVYRIVSYCVGWMGWDGIG